jgi:hypothetical protein
VRIRAEDGIERASAADDSALMAESIARVTREIFPGFEVPVEVDFHVMPDGQPFSLIRRVQWHEGDSFQVSGFAYESVPQVNGPLHDLYSVLSARWPVYDEMDPELDYVAQEFSRIAARMFSACGTVLAGGTVSAELFRTRFNLNGRLIDKTPLIGEVLGNGFVRHGLGIEGGIAPRSSEARRLLEACQRIVPDPMSLEMELQRIADELNP